MLIYTFDIIQDVIFNSERTQLPKETIDIIDKLNLKVTSPNYVRTPNFRRANNEYKEWENIRNFKVTKITNINKNIDKTINDIRCVLNKLTENNFQETHSSIVTMMGSELSVEDLMKVSQLIFKTSTQNRFMSLAYAKLYKLLMQNYPVMAELSNASLKDFMGVFSNIKYINPNDDYDGYCRMNETNEYRRALAVFFVNLMNIEIVEPNKITDIIIQLQDTIFDNASHIDKRKVIDEIVENIFLLITLGKDMLRNTDKWDTIIGNINNVKNINVKEYKGITNKTIFKHSDILDSIN